MILGPFAIHIAGIVLYAIIGSAVLIGVLLLLRKKK